MNGATALVAVFVAYGLMASRLDRWLITAPIFFVAIGLVLGPSGVGVLPGLESETTLLITELTLGVLLFADAATVRLREVEGDARLPVRLLLVGLPLTIALGTVAARLLFPEAGWAASALIASILAPTDAALGLAVVTNPAVPARIRRALNVESGLNDGIATPFVTLFLSLVIAEEEGLGSGHWAAEAAKEIGLALVAAVVVGVLGGKLMVVARRHGWTSAISEQLVVLALSLLSYVGAVAVGGNGFVAAFVGGLLFGASTSAQMHKPVEFTETVGLFASFFVWTVFGAIFVGPVVTGDIEPVAILYAVISLTVVRMLPVAAALTGVGLRRDTVAFMGWFGPRGLASVVFTLIAFEDLHGAGPIADAIVEIATWTILLSVVAHGLSAGPFATAYGHRLHEAGDIPELADMPEPRIRRRTIAE